MCIDKIITYVVRANSLALKRNTQQHSNNTETTLNNSWSTLGTTLFLALSLALSLSLSLALSHSRKHADIQHTTTDFGNGAHFETRIGGVGMGGRRRGPSHFDSADWGCFSTSCAANQTHVLCQILRHCLCTCTCSIGLCAHLFNIFELFFVKSFPFPLEPPCCCCAVPIGR